MKILFVCTGNMHRSPLAEAMLRQALARDGRTDVTVTSAGVLGLVNSSVISPAAELARADGIDVSDHRSRALTVEHLGADLILAMEPEHLEEIASIDPAARSRCRLLSEYGDATVIRPGDLVPDANPADSDSYRRSYTIIRSCIEGLYRRLPPAPQEVYANAVEERFRNHRRSSVGLSPADYALVSDWWERSIPLWLVLESLESSLGKRESAVQERVQTLSFCRPEVERRFKAFGRSQIPTPHRDEPRETQAVVVALLAARKLKESAERARDAARDREADLLDEAATAARCLASEEDRDAASIQLELLSVEHHLLDSFIELTPAEQLDAMREEAEKTLAGHRERMTPEAFDKTVARMVARSIRDYHAIPVLIEG